jgi:DNA-binding transcriptional regulator YdaS (Cro superfamily)
MHLDEYLFKNKITKVNFAKMLGMSYTGFHKLVKGNMDMSISIGKRIEILTKGQVTFDDLYEKMMEYQKLNNKKQNKDQPKSKNVKGEASK